ncbi:hypothetical protein Adt_21057 [Abeliophyllum distichum]|uniref:Uncharacterized protein n=1 Tax=Abeliophyllum distichum TaxID=126358 RepID=A0ABD1SYI2_9LAMI
MMAAKVRELRPGSSEDTGQKKTIEEISKEATLEEAQNIAPNQTAEKLSSGDEEPLAKKRRETSACVKSSHRRIAMRVKPVDDATSKEKSVRAAAQMMSIIAMRKMKKKMVDASKAIFQSDQIKECLDSTVALAKSDKLA